MAKQKSRASQARNKFSNKRILIYVFIAAVVVFLSLMLVAFIGAWRLSNAINGSDRKVHHENTLDELIGNPSSFPEEYRKITPSRETYSPDSESTRIATELVHTYFSFYKNSSLSNHDRLTDYSIEKVTGTKTKENLFIELTYSVKPGHEEAFWNAGNGIPSADGWIRNKYGCTSVLQVGNAYARIEGIGSACGMPE